MSVDDTDLPGSWRAIGLRGHRWSTHAVPAYALLAIAAAALPEFDQLRVSANAHFPFVLALTIAAVVAAAGTWLRVREEPSSDAVLVFVAFAALAGVYSPHVLLTDTGVDPAHLVFGPVSRAVFSVTIVAALVGVRVPRVFRSPGAAIVLAGAIIGTVDLYLHSAGFEELLAADPIRVLRGAEWVSVTADVGALVWIALKGRSRDGMFVGMLTRVLTAMLLSSTLFLLSVPWQTRWWAAHLGLLVTAVVVTAHVLRQRVMAGSLAAVVDSDVVTSVADLLIDELDSGLVLIDGDGEIVGWNRGAQEMTGWDREFASRYFPREPLNDVVGIGPATVRVRQTEIERLGRPIRVTVMQDVSNEVRLRGEKSRLDQLTSDLEQAMKEKNQLLGVVAHELRNPLGALRGFAMVVRAHAAEALDETSGMLLDRMVASSERMLDLVDDLLSLSSLNASTAGPRLERAPRDVAEIVSSVIELESVSAREKGIALRLDVRGGTHTAEVDGRKIEQVVTNLISNAVKFSEPGTSVACIVEEAGTDVRIAVRDEGPGVPADELPIIFDPFARTSVQPTAGERSTGLGLAITKRLVDAHGGRIEIDSTQGEGSTFTVTLPRRATSVAHPADEGAAV